MKTFMAKKGQVPQRWLVVDLDGKVLGRAAVRIATILMGKHRPEYTPHVDTGDFVVAINASKVRFTGKSKAAQQTYETYSRHPGGRKVYKLEDVLAKHPDRVIQAAVRRMLPKTKLGTHMLKKLKIYPGSEHPHQAQQPETLEL